MDLRHLKYFVAVAEEENITRAAIRLNISQPSLSRQIKDLEMELGVELFNRTAKTISLTFTGRYFLQEVRMLLNQLDELTHSLRDFTKLDKDSIKVGYAPSLVTQMLPEILRSFRSNYPDVRVKLHDLTTNEMIEGLRNEDLDVALLIKPDVLAMKDLSYKELRSLAPYIAMPSHHPLSAKPDIHVRDLLSQSLIVYSHDDYPEYHTWLKQFFNQGHHPKIVAESDSASGLIASLESGLGIAIVQEGFEIPVSSQIILRSINVDADKKFSFGTAHRTKEKSSTIEQFLLSCTVVASQTAI